MNESDFAIKVHKVRKSFILPEERINSLKQLFVRMGRPGKNRRQVVLKSMSFDIKEGEFVGIVGRNGNGKSTLLKILAGVYSPDSGSVEVRGKLAPFIELGVGFNPELTGRDNVFLNGALLGFTHKEMEAMYDSIVEFAELETFMDRKLKNYSSGMQVRLAFSIAIKANSDVLLIDEVLAVGDAAFQQKCFNHFEDLRHRKKTVVFVSHDMSAVRRFCSRAIYIKDGRIIHDGTPADVADIYTQENIETAAPETDQGAKLPETHAITAHIASQHNGQLRFDITYKSDDDQPMYTGIAILKEGISLAEITTPTDMKLVGNGKITYTLHTGLFNHGSYHIGAGLFRFKNRELVAASADKCYFTVKGEDITRGSALKLEHHWKQHAQN